MPLYKLLKKSDRFQWTNEAMKAFDRLKSFLAKPPTLISPEPDEPLMLYITATMQVVSVPLVVERDDCWHFLASSPGSLVPANGTRKLVGYFNDHE
jgi:hypothetical protein